MPLAWLEAITSFSSSTPMTSIFRCSIRWQLDFPTRTLVTYKLGRHKEAVIGILEFIRDEDELFKHRFQDKTRFITKHLNFIGGVKPISYYDREFFKRELRKVSHEIALI